MNEDHNKIIISPAFKKLVKTRWTISILLTLVILLVYFGFIGTIAFNKELLATKIQKNVTLGIPIGIGIIIFSWILTGLYVWWANNKYDHKVKDIKSQLSK
ncbi:MAG: DUF485 domain-containing protein [Cytophagaceae bacterium]|nr:DUF485 domain-containing protein [Cytophagaceae bacterium]